jgi:putative ABC transport system ATP-binding protein
LKNKALEASSKPDHGPTMPLLRQLSQEQAAPLRNEHVGYVFFQTFNLIPVITAYENVELPLLLTKLSAQQRCEHVMTALSW